MEFAVNRLGAAASTDRLMRWFAFWEQLDENLRLAVIALADAAQLAPFGSGDDFFRIMENVVERRLKLSERFLGDHTTRVAVAVEAGEVATSGRSENESP